MKKRNKHTHKYKTSIFLTVLNTLLIFTVAIYLIIIFSIKYGFVIKENQNNLEDLKNLQTGVTLEQSKEQDYSITFYSNYEERSGASALKVNLIDDKYVLADETIQSFRIVLQTQTQNYDIFIPFYNSKIKIGDSISGNFYLFENPSLYAPTYMYLEDRLIYQTESNKEASFLSGIVNKVEYPSSLNFIYKQTTVSSVYIESLNININKFASLSKGIAFFYDNEENRIFYLIDAGYEDDSFILCVHQTSSYESLIGSVSILFFTTSLLLVAACITIALILSHKYSKPIYTIKKEVEGISNEDYSTSNYDFKYQELLDLQKALNLIKMEMENKISSLNKSNNDLEQANSELSQIEAVRSTFVSQLSHELKTPLMTISAYVEALRDGIIKEEEKEQTYSTILTAIDKSTDITKSLIKTYKTLSTSITLNLEDINLKDVCEGLIEEISPLYSKNANPFNKDLEDCPTIKADKNLISQVISNFLTNAAKHTPRGANIDISLLNKKESIIFEVRNYGAHISDDLLSKIWTPEFTTISKDNVSTGVGLYICKKILLAHGYDFGVSNEGSCVKSYFIIKK